MAVWIAVLLSIPVAAQDTVEVSAERPGQDAAVAFIDMLWDAMPEDDVLIYLNCAQADCASQAPGWFSVVAWEEGLSEAGVYEPNPSLGISSERLQSIRDANTSPPALASTLARELVQRGQGVSAVLLVYPGQHGEKLQLSYQLHYTDAMRRDKLGRLTVRLPPPPPPLPPQQPPYWSKRGARAGAGTLVAGLTMVTASSVRLLQGGSDPRLMDATMLLGWSAVVGGGALMLAPAVRDDAVYPTHQGAF